MNSTCSLSLSWCYWHSSFCYAHHSVPLMSLTAFSSSPQPQPFWSFVLISPYPWRESSFGWIGFRERLDLKELLTAGEAQVSWQVLGLEYSKSLPSVVSASLPYYYARVNWRLQHSLPDTRLFDCSPDQCRNPVPTDHIAISRSEFYILSGEFFQYSSFWVLCLFCQVVCCKCP